MIRQLEPGRGWFTARGQKIGRPSGVATSVRIQGLGDIPLVTAGPTWGMGPGSWLAYRPPPTTGYDAYFGALGGWWDLVSGKSDYWYQNLDRVQNEIAIAMAQVEAVPAALWKTVWEKKGLPQYADRDAVKDNLLYNFQSILVTTKRVPTDESISTAEAKVQDTEWMLSEVARLAPEVKAEMEIQQARVAAALSNSKLESPTTVGREVFMDKLEKRAKLFTAGFGAVAGIALVAVAAIFILPRFMK
jgi:hypothetical protein